jgi:hypothetical protein
VALSCHYMSFEKHPLASLKTTKRAILLVRESLFALSAEPSLSPRARATESTAHTKNVQHLAFNLTIPHNYLLECFPLAGFAAFVDGGVAKSMRKV